MAIVMASYTFGFVNMSNFLTNIIWEELFFSCIRRNRVAESDSKVLKQVNGDASLSKKSSVIGSVASKTVISMLTTVRVNEGQQLSKMDDLGNENRLQLSQLSRAIRENLMPHVVEPINKMGSSTQQTRFPR